MTHPIGVQLYSLRDALQDDFSGIIEQLAQAGYVGAEPFSGMPVSPAEGARILKDYGFQLPSAHMALPIGPDEKATLEAAAAYGVQTIVVPYQSPQRFASVDAIKLVADDLNKAAQTAQANGFRLAYHNHEFEFQMVAGRSAFDRLLDELDAAVLIELDTYWARVGGQDAAALVQRLGQRAPLLHIKDGPADPADRNAPMTAAGQGTMDVRGIVAAATGADWLIVELDHCATDMLTAVKDSYTYMIGEGLAHGRA